MTLAAAGSSFSQAAQLYAGLGINVFPLRPRGKKPLPYTTGLLAASADPHLAVRRWAGEVDLPLRPPKDEKERLPDRVRANPRCNVAGATGPGSGFWVLDLDGDDAEAWFVRMVAEHGPLPVTPEQKTGGGRQLLFAWDPEIDITNSVSRIAPGVDIRGRGGYIALPPSVHPGTPKKGIPPGRIYTWLPARGPLDIPIAAAPAWLVQLARPPVEAPAADSPPARPREVERFAGTTRFGQATLATSCREVLRAPEGKRQDTIWRYAAFVGGYVAGGEIDRGHALAELTHAALNMEAGRCDTDAMIRRHVDRGLTAGERHPKTAPPLQRTGDAGRPGDAGRLGDAGRSSGSAAGRRDERGDGVDLGALEGVTGARALWSAAQPADCRAVRSWFAAHALDPDGLPGGLAGLRAHPRAPIGVDEDGFEQLGAAMLLPLTAALDGGDWIQEIDALAVLDLRRGRITRFVGPARRLAAVLCPPDAATDLVVALDFVDAWTLGQNAHENGHALGVVLTPTLRAFAGGHREDRFGRLDPRTPHADPDDPPWTAPDAGAVFLAVRGDLRSPEFKSRRAMGGTARLSLQGDAAARFYGGLAEQAWRRAGANPVRILRPSHGAGFGAGLREGPRHGR